jgi:hypothetical protein
MIPKPQHSDSVISKDVRAPLISNLPWPIIMSATIYFDRELYLCAIKIEYVAGERMLAAEFISREVSVPEMAPENALSVSCLFSQHASAVHEASM